MTRRVASAILGFVVCVAGLVGIYVYVIGMDRSRVLLVLEVDGTVMVEPQSGPAVAAQQGQELSSGDRVSTAADARAVLALGDNRIRVSPESSLVVQKVDEEGVSLELENGALHATVRPESGAVRVSNRGRAVLSTGGSFAVGTRDGLLQVQALEGELMMAGVDGVRLEPGAVATVSDGHADIGPIPDTMLLDVTWPEGLERVRSDAFVVEGTTAPGARVTVSGPFGERLVIADPTGAFSAEVPLREGDNEVRLAAVDLLGNTVSVSGRLPDRDTMGPSTFKIGVEYGN